MGCADFTAESSKYGNWLRAASFLAAVTFLYVGTLFDVTATQPFRGSGDYLQFAWNFWWLKKCVMGQLLPFFTTWQYFPSGTSLALHDMSYHWSIASLPFQLILAPDRSVDLFLGLSFFLTGIATFALLRGLGLSNIAAVWGAGVFAFCPHRLNRLHFGELNSLAMMYFPLVLLLTVRLFSPDSLRSRDDLRHGSLLGGAFALCALASWYNGLFAGVIFAVTAFVFLLFHRRLPWRGGMAAAFLATGILLPFVLPMVLALQDGTYTAVATQAFVRSSDANNADLLSFVVPDPFVSSAFLRQLSYWSGVDFTGWAQSVTASYVGNPHEKGVFLTWTLLVLAVGGSFALRPDRVHRPVIAAVVAIGLCGFILSLGPTVYFGGRPIASVQWVYELLSQFPIVSVSRTPSRYGILVLFSLAILSAFVLDSILCRLRHYPIMRILMPLFLGCCYFLETYPGPPKRAQTSGFDSPVFVQMRSDPTAGVVLNVPVDFYGARGGGSIFLFEQTLHERRIIGGYVSREDTRALTVLEESPMLQSLHHQLYGSIPVLTDGVNNTNGNDLGGSLSPQAIASELDRLEVAFVMLHKRLLKVDLDDLRAKFISAGCAPFFEDTYRFVCRVGPRASL